MSGRHTVDEAVFRMRGVVESRRSDGATLARHNLENCESLNTPAGGATLPTIDTPDPKTRPNRAIAAILKCGIQVAHFMPRRSRKRVCLVISASIETHTEQRTQK
eukprot:2151789-Pyramimonas_sp.AAC.1